MPRNIIQEGIRKDGLAASGRGARIELGVPVPDDRLRRKNLCGSLDLDQHDQQGHSYDGRCRVHHDAELAMVGGIAVEGMRVRHLDYSQQRQQGKTHHSDQRQSTWLWPSNPA